MDDNFWGMSDGLYLREVGPVRIAEKFPKVPGLYTFNGPIKHICHCRPGADIPGTVSFLVLVDPHLAKRDKEAREKFKKDSAEWPKRVEDWEAGSKKTGFFKTDKPKAPEQPPPLEGPPVVVLKLGDDTPAKVFGEGRFLGQVGNLCFFTFPKQVLAMSGVFGKLFGGL